MISESTLREKGVNAAVFAFWPKAMLTAAGCAACFAAMTVAAFFASPACAAAP